MDVLLGSDRVRVSLQSSLSSWHGLHAGQPRRQGFRSGHDMSLLCPCRAYVQGGLFDKARAAAQGDPALQDYVQQHHAQHLVAARDAEGLASAGNAAQAVELFAQRGDWGRVHELAAQAGPDAQARYAVRWAALAHWVL